MSRITNTNLKFVVAAVAACFIAAPAMAGTAQLKQINGPSVSGVSWLGAQPAYGLNGNTFAGFAFYSDYSPRIYGGNVSSPSLYLSTGDAAPGLTGVTVTDQVGADVMNSLSTGELFFSTKLSGAGVTSANNYAYYRTGDSVPLLRLGSQAPGFDPTYTMVEFDVGSAGGRGEDVWMSVEISGPGILSGFNDDVLYVAQPGQPARPVVQDAVTGYLDNAAESLEIEGASGSQGIGYAASSFGGNVLFGADIYTDNHTTLVGQGLYTVNDDNTITELFRTGGAAPGLAGNTIDDFEHLRKHHKVAVNVLGKPLLIADLDDGLTVAESLCGLEDDGTLSLIAQVGQTAPAAMGTFTDLTVGTRHYLHGDSGGDSIAFLAETTAGRGLFWNTDGVTELLLAEAAGMYIEDLVMAADGSVAAWGTIGGTTTLWLFDAAGSLFDELRDGDVIEIDRGSGPVNVILDGIHAFGGYTCALETDGTFVTAMSIQGLPQLVKVQVPEPASMGLLAVGGLLGVLRRHR